MNLHDITPTITPEYMIARAIEHGNGEPPNTWTVRRRFDGEFEVNNRDPRWWTITKTSADYWIQYYKDNKLGPV